MHRNDQASGGQPEDWSQPHSMSALLDRSHNAIGYRPAGIRRRGHGERMDEQLHPFFELPAGSAASRMPVERPIVPRAGLAVDLLLQRLFKFVASHVQVRFLLRGA
jgi:hypothetical protein